MSEGARIVRLPETSAELRSVRAEGSCVVIEFGPYAERQRTERLLREFRLLADEPLDFSSAFLAPRDPERS